MTVQPGSARLTSNTVRPAEKGAERDAIDPAVMRRTIDAVVSATGCRRRDARERIRSWVAGGVASSDLEAYLRATFRVDPTGVTAVRNVMRGGGHASH